MEREKALESIREYFEENKKTLFLRFQEIFEEHTPQMMEQIYESIQKLNWNHPIQILQFQIKRVDLYQGQSLLSVCGYDKRWYLDEAYEEDKIMTTYLFEPFAQLQKEMLQESRKYLGSVSIYDIKNIVNEFFQECFKNQIEAVRGYFENFDQWLKAQGLEMKAPYHLIWGDSILNGATLYYEDKPGKTGEQIQKEIERDREEEKEIHLHNSWNESNLEKLAFEQEKFLFLNVKRAQSTEVDFKHCMVGRASFHRSEFQWCSMEKSQWYSCDFRQIKGYQLDFTNAQILTSSFENCWLRKGKFDGATLENVVFKDATLQECSFKNARMKNVDLRAVELTGADFSGAVLEQVYINEKDAPYLELTSEQEKNVYVIGESNEVF